MLFEDESSLGPGASDEAPSPGSLIVNADDWGRGRETTDRIVECWARGCLSSVSAMVFMSDSKRAADLVRETGIDAGLHLNFTTPFSAPDCPVPLAEHQQRIARCLLRHRFAQVLFHPTLARSFEYVVSAQEDEFHRLYGVAPQRYDGHHHMHLCSNILIQRLLPRGTAVRRNFSFEAGEKSFANRLYRGLLDRVLARRHHLTEFFFSLKPLEPRNRLQRIFSLGRRFVVELETHPSDLEEYRFLTGGEIFAACGAGIERAYNLRRFRGSSASKPARLAAPK
jgi:predicted glycoside hydrolase/deacetylase ChbG (UPF0249 family)